MARCIRLALLASLIVLGALTPPSSNAAQLRPAHPQQAATDSSQRLPSLSEVYAHAPRNAAAFWIRDERPTAQAVMLIRLLCSAETYGLRSGDYLDCERFEPARGGPNGAAPWPLSNREFDTALTTAALRFLRDVHFGRVSPRRAGLELRIERAPVDYASGLAALASASDPGALVESWEPPFEHYRLLKRALARFRSLAAGQVTAATRAEIRSAPYERRIRQIELTLERWRWLPTFDAPPIIVNIPQFRLFAFRSNRDAKQDILQMDVIVGKSFPRLRTPVFAADLTYVVFRPYWDIPASITRKEMLPELQRDPGFFTRQHLQLLAGPGDSAPVVPFSSQGLTALESGHLRLRQLPGPDNALGLIKFVLPNPFDVYLHSTPAHRLFNQSHRAFSHGCIRVSDPVELALHVLRNAPGTWSEEAIRSAMTGTTNAVRVNLKTPIHVFILYATALAREDGVVEFFEDIYGHDRTLETLLGLPAVSTRAAQRR